MSDDYESLPDTVPFLNHLLAGAFAGIAEHSIIYPIDNIKTRIQALVGTTTKSALSSLWKGLLAVIIGAGPAHAVYFGTYELAKTHLIDGTETQDVSHYAKIALAGLVATAASEALMNPFDTVKQRMQLNSSFSPKSKQFRPHYTLVLRTMKYILRKEGASAFYYSYPTTLFMTVPFHMSNFLVYETVTDFLNPDNAYRPAVHCIAGGMAGGLASAITTPFDCVKTVLQTHSFTRKFEEVPGLLASKLAQAQAHTTAHESTATLQMARNLHQSLAVSGAKINSFMSAARHIYVHHGLKGFTRGMKARVASNIPATAISWSSYEMAKFYLNKDNGASFR